MGGEIQKELFRGTDNRNVAGRHFDSGQCDGMTCTDRPVAAALAMLPHIATDCMVQPGLQVAPLSHL